MKRCKFPDCPLPPVTFPKLKGYCQTHAILEVLRQSELEAVKSKTELELYREQLKNEKKTKSKYTATLWKNLSQYIILKHADENLMVRCSTDPSLIYHVKSRKICGGHYLKADDWPNIKYEIKNILPQSSQQNKFGGNMEAMKVAINKEHGEGTTDWLESIKSNIPLDVLEMDRLSKVYLGLLNEEIKRRNLKRSPWK